MIYKKSPFTVTESVGAALAHLLSKELKTPVQLSVIVDLHVDWLKKKTAMLLHKTCQGWLVRTSHLNIYVLVFSISTYL